MYDHERFLTPCRKLWGYALLREGAPPIRVARDVFFENNGLYDFRRRLLLDSAYITGLPLPHRAGGEPAQSLTSQRRIEAITSELTASPLIWCGVLHDHFGHFLIDTLPRLWPLREWGGSPPTLVFYSLGDTLENLLKPFVLSILATLGIERKHILLLTQPTKIPEIIVPETSFEANHYCYGEYRQLCRSISQKIAAPSAGFEPRPLYLTKVKVKTGVSRIINEADLAERLAFRGVEVISPESLPFSEQVALWQQDRPICAYLGSQTHLSTFSPVRELIYINHEHQLFSNQIMLDAVSDHRVGYYAPSMVDALGRDNDFHLNFRIADPVRVADALLKLVELRAVTRAIDLLRPSTVDPRRRVDEPLGVNLSIGRAARQSSTFPPHSADPDPTLDAGRAVSGILPARYAFHTAREQKPWWLVDLGTIAEINEVRVFNRFDMSHHFAATLSILTSEDGNEWQTRYVRHPAELFGVDGNPFRWHPVCQVLGRYVKLTIDGPAFFHLSQVEVFGQKPLSRTPIEDEGALLDRVNKPNG